VTTRKSKRADEEQKVEGKVDCSERKGVLQQGTEIAGTEFGSRLKEGQKGGSKEEHIVAQILGTLTTD